MLLSLHACLCSDTDKSTGELLSICVSTLPAQLLSVLAWLTPLVRLHLAFCNDSNLQAGGKDFRDLL